MLSILYVNAVIGICFRIKGKCHIKILIFETVPSPEHFELLSCSETLYLIPDMPYLDSLRKNTYYLDLFHSRIK